MSKTINFNEDELETLMCLLIYCSRYHPNYQKDANDLFSKIFNEENQQALFSPCSEVSDKEHTVIRKANRKAQLMIH